MSIESAEPAAPTVRTQPVAPAPAAIEPDELRVAEMFADLRPDEIAWIAAHCERMVLAPGQLLLVSGQPAEWMFIGLRGTVEIRREQLGASVPAYVFHAGDVAGVIPYSRMKAFVGNGRARDARRRRALSTYTLPRLCAACRRLHRDSSRLLADRVRDATRREAQLERLLALGKLSAGIAHELNNPVSAIINSFAEAGRRLRYRGALVVELVRCGASPDVLERLASLRPAADARERALDPIARSDRLDQVDAWLRRVGLAEPWTYAATFVDAGLDVPDLEAAMAEVPEAARPAALRWLESGLALEGCSRPPSAPASASPKSSTR